MHLSANGDQLDDPMIFPTPFSLQDINFILHVIQLNNVWFFLQSSPFLGGFRWVRDTLMWASLWGPCREVNGGGRCAMQRRRCKPHSSNWTHEIRREHKRHLATKRLETLEKWWRRYAASLDMEFTTPHGRIGVGGVVGIGSAHVRPRHLRIHTEMRKTNPLKNK